METKIIISLNTKKQLPDLMIVKEYHLLGEVVNAKVLYQEDLCNSDVIFKCGKK